MSTTNTETPPSLVDAAFCCDLTAVRALLDAGADVDCRDDFNSTALHWAVNFHQTDMVELLLEHGADVSIVDNAGDDAAFFAGDNGDVGLVARLEACRTRQIESGRPGSNVLSDPS